MKKSTKYIVIVFLFLLIALIVFLVSMSFYQNHVKSKENIISSTPITTQNNTEENALVVGISKDPGTEEVPEPEQPEPEPEKDPATLTQEIYNMNTTIGTLYIPKTKLTTEIYSNSDVDKMEKMPCFLYTSGGLNKKGVTLLIGHNKRNGKLFSNNKKLEEGDEFYFTDYEGNEIKYTIYSKFITTDDDVSFLSEKVDVPTIALSCCTDANNENRIIILGRAD